MHILVRRGGRCGFVVFGEFVDWTENVGRFFDKRKFLANTKIRARQLNFYPLSKTGGFSFPPASFPPLFIMTAPKFPFFSALTENIVKVLPKFKCPHSIEPHQIQGLDCIRIFPVIKVRLLLVCFRKQY